MSQGGTPDGSRSKSGIKMVLLPGKLFHLLTTVSTLIFGGFHPQQTINTVVAFSKSISGETRSHQQKQATGSPILAKLQKHGRGGGEPKGLSKSQQGTGKSSKKRREELAQHASGRMKGAQDGFQDVLPQISSSSFQQEDGPNSPIIPVDLQMDQNQESAKETFIPYSDSSAAQQSNAEKISSPTVESLEKIRLEGSPPTHRFPRAMKINSSTASKVSFKNIKAPNLSVPTSSQQPTPTQNQPGRLQQPIVQQGQPQQPIAQAQQPAIQQPQSNLLTTPIPPPINTSNLSPLENLQLTSPLPELPPPPADVEVNAPVQVLPPPVGDMTIDQNQFDDVGKMPPPPLENTLDQPESLFQKALKETKLKPSVKPARPPSITPTEAENAKQKLKKTPVVAQQQAPLTEAQEGMKNLRPTQTIKQPEATNPLLSQIQKGLALKKTDTGELLRQEEEKRQQEMALQREALTKEGRPVPTLDKLEAKIKEAKEIERLENEKNAKRASDSYTKVMKEVEVRKIADRGRTNLLESIKQEHKLKPATQHVLPPLAQKDEKTLLIEEKNKKILARRPAMEIDDKTENDEEEVNEPAPQRKEETKAKTANTGQVKTGKSLEETLKEKIKKLPPSGSSGKEDDDDGGWKE